MRIGDFDLDHKVLIVAEIGNNHEGSPDEARRLIEAAADSGVRAVKIQVIDPERLVNCKEAERIAQLGRFRLSSQLIEELSRRARERGMLFLASAFDPDSLEAVAPCLDAVKIASGDIDYGALQRRAAALGKPIIQSTGTASEDDIRAAISTIETGLPEGTPISERLALLHCVSLYPTPVDHANLRAMERLRTDFGLTVGYSDHVLGIEVAAASIALGARIVEKHLTLDKSRTDFRDHTLSADPEDMRRLVELAAAAEGMLGHGQARISEQESSTATQVRRSLVAAKDLPRGKLLEAGDLDAVRPANGLSPRLAPQLIGKRLKIKRARHELIKEEHLE